MTVKVGWRAAEHAALCWDLPEKAEADYLAAAVEQSEQRAWQPSS